MNKNSSEAGKEHRGVPSSESQATLKLNASRDIRDEVIEEFMRSLVCDKFQIDPHSRFCNECGYSRPEHRKQRV